MRSIRWHWLDDCFAPAMLTFYVNGNSISKTFILLVFFLNLLFSGILSLWRIVFLKLSVRLMAGYERLATGCDLFRRVLERQINSFPRLIWNCKLHFHAHMSKMYILWSERPLWRYTAFKVMLSEC